MLDLGGRGAGGRRSEREVAQLAGSETPTNPIVKQRRRGASSEQALPLGSDDPRKEKRRVRTILATHELLPKGLDLEGLGIETGRVSIRLSSGARRRICPVCGRGLSRDTAATPARFRTYPGTGSWWRSRSAPVASSATRARARGHLLRAAAGRGRPRPQDRPFGRGADGDRTRVERQGRGEQKIPGALQSVEFLRKRTRIGFADSDLSAKDLPARDQEICSPFPLCPGASDEPSSRLRAYATASSKVSARLSVRAASKTRSPRSERALEMTLSYMERSGL